MAISEHIPIKADTDVLAARQKGRALGLQAGFASIDITLLATAISELARNILLYAREGEIELRLLHEGGRRGVMVVASDQGPGIADIERALQDGFSTSGGLGLGLPGVKRLMDSFEIRSLPGQGTVVTAVKWELR